MSRIAAPPVAWIVGASRGIGREIAREFSLLGFHVCLSSRQRSELRRVAAGIAGLGGSCSVHPCDLLRTGQITAVSREILSRFGRVDVLVCNAGITTFRDFQDTSLRTMHEIIGVDLEGHLACIRSVLPSMQKRRSGWIFTIGSIAAVKIFTGSAVYSAAKSGLRAALKVIREENRHTGVRCVEIVPGPTTTAMWSDKVLKKYSRRMMNPRSVAATVIAAYQMPPDLVAEEIVVRPATGDLDS